MADPSWGTCLTCGDATPPGALVCPTCGKEGPVTPAELASRPKNSRLRLRLHKWLRGSIVIGVVVALAAAIVPAALSGPPSVDDPLSVTTSYTVTAGHYAVLSGQITGEDYVLGNYSVVSPPGAIADLAIYNSTEFATFVNDPASATPAYAENSTSARIVFSALETDTYYLVWQNPYAASTGLTLVVYVHTEYQSNVNVQ
jgi:hypothetical protein